MSPKPSEPVVRHCPIALDRGKVATLARQPRDAGKRSALDLGRRGLNGVPTEVLQNLEMMQLLAPMLRADFEAVETYRFKPGGPPLDCPIIAFGGTDEPRVRPERIEAWAVQTNSRFEIINLPGDHFFVNTAKDSILQSVSSEIQCLFPSI